MEKKALITIKNQDGKQSDNVQIIKHKNKISYQETTGTSVLFDLDSLELIRDNKQIYMELNFSVKNASIYIKELGKTLELEIEVKKVEVTENRVILEYKISDELYEYKLEME